MAVEPHPTAGPGGAQLVVGHAAARFAYHGGARRPPKETAMIHAVDRCLAPFFLATVLAASVVHAQEMCGNCADDDADRLVEHAHDGVDLFHTDDERRRNGVNVSTAEQAHEHTAAEGLVADLQRDALGEWKPLARRLVDQPRRR